MKLPKKGESPTRELFICECHSTEHQFLVCYLPGDDKYEYDELSLEVHLTPKHGFWKRLWGAIKYVFGYRSRYGNWDSVIINPDDIDKLHEILEYYKQSRLDTTQAIRNARRS